MKFYEKYYPSNYEELISYYPRYYREVFEMVEILKAHGRIGDSIEWNIEQTYLNGFIDYADEATISKYEKFLEIGLNKNRTLEERRRLVKSYFVGSGKMSESKIKEIIKIFTKNTARVDFPTDRLQIHIDLQDIDTIYLKDIRIALKKRIPAHLDMAVIGDIFLQLKFCITYNTKLIIKNAFYPRANIPYLYYDGSAKYDGTFRYNKYRTDENIQLYPIKMGIKSEITPQIFYYPKLLLKHSLPAPVNLETKINYKKEMEIGPKITEKLKITKEQAILPRYQIRLKIGKHPNRYNGMCRYDGKSQHYVEYEEII